jgi:ADP-dependent NAD(P)H-hydrate dehydratase / NAD(P)H-hydrate epimerase
MMPASHPILECDAARALEARRFAGDEEAEWAAMQAAGRAVAAAVREDFREIGPWPAAPRVLVLVGKGHNGGDALIAAQTLRAQAPGARIEVVFVFGARALRPLAQRAWQAARDFTVVPAARLGEAEGAAREYDVCLDGVFGFQFRPPLDVAVARLLETVNALPIRLRAAVDLPSAGRFRADFTYATGSVKAPVLAAGGAAGRVRYLDLGFFRGDEPGRDRVLTAGVLAPLGALRPPASDKRTYGHVAVIGGSRSYPGAVLMTVLAALRSGAGLVTAFVPESVAPTFAARAPEAMWVAWPETPGGGLALEGEHLWRSRAERITALVMGPGLGREPETLALARSIVAGAAVPMVLDADALQPEIVAAGRSPRIITPHAGEFARISGGAALDHWRPGGHVTTVLKGPVTRIATPDAVYHSFHGGPALARGGSGDLLAGLTGGLLAQTPGAPALAAARGVVWHGRAADLLARDRGQVAVSVTQLLDFLPAVLRAEK